MTGANHKVWCGGARQATKTDTRGQVSEIHLKIAFNMIQVFSTYSLSARCVKSV